jgi:hypothetical protein
MHVVMAAILIPITALQGVDLGICSLFGKQSVGRHCFRHLQQDWMENNIQLLLIISFCLCTLFHVISDQLIIN